MNRRFFESDWSESEEGWGFKEIFADKSLGKVGVFGDFDILNLGVICQNSSSNRAPRIDTTVKSPHARPLVSGGAEFSPECPAIEVDR